MPHPLADLIPSNNVFQLPRTLKRGLAAATLERFYDEFGGRFIGAFIDKDGQPDWARRIARYDRDDFHKNTPGTKHRTSDIASTLTSGEGQSFPNFRYALERWDGEGDKPFTRYQQTGICVEAQSTEGEEMMMGYRAARPQYGEAFKYACSYGAYEWRGHCSDGWNGSGLSAVKRRTGAFFAMLYQDGSNTRDMRDEAKAEMLVARTYCRNPQQWYADYANKHHPYEDGAITEFDGDKAGVRDVLASGGYLATGGTNTSGSSKPFVVGRVGGHEQAFLGGDDSEECRKFFRDKGFTIPDGDCACVASQTWGEGWSGEIADQYWPVGTLADGTVLTQAELNGIRHANGESTARAVALSLAGTWGWGEKPEGAWVWRASQVLQYFGGDIFAFLPRVKGFEGEPAPTPIPTPVPVPVPIPPGGLMVDVVVHGHVPPGKYILFSKSDV